MNTPTMRTKADNIPLPKTLHLSKADLLVDGSITPQTINVTGFPVGSWITLLVLNIHFEDNALDFDQWGSGAALTNGTAFLIDSRSMLGENLTTNHGFGHVSGDLTIFTDEKNPKDRHFVSKFALAEVVPPWGILWTTNESMQFLVQDNQTAAANGIDAFEITVEGFSIPDEVPAEDRGKDIFRQAFSEKALVFPSPLYALGLILLVLAAFYMIYRLVIK